MRKSALLLTRCMNALGLSKHAATGGKGRRCTAHRRRDHECHAGHLSSGAGAGWSIEMVERQDKVAEESSNGWNNAGTGHSALAEMNYTPEKNGAVDIAKAIEINEAFQISRQFWASRFRKAPCIPHAVLSTPPRT